MLRSFRTVACKTTRLTADLILYASSGGFCGGALGATGAVEGETGCCCCANAPVHRSAANAARKNVRIIAVSRLPLLGGRVVTGFGVDVKGREPFGRLELDLDFSPDAVALRVAWFISQDILVS